MLISLFHSVYFKLKIKVIGETSSIKETATEKEPQLSGSSMATLVSTLESPQLLVTTKVLTHPLQSHSTNGSTSPISSKDKSLSFTTTVNLLTQRIFQDNPKLTPVHSTSLRTHGTMVSSELVSITSKSITEP